MTTPEERFDMACKELGWGDAEGGLWFVSIEEGSVWKLGQEEQIELHYGHGKYFRNDVDAANNLASNTKGSTNRSQIEIVESKIALSCSRSAATWQEFQKKIWKNRSKVAHANLYPLGKPEASDSLPAGYSQLFGFGSDHKERARYRAAVKLKRFPRLRSAREELQPQAVVCLGKTYWDDFREAFELTGKETALDEGKVEIYEAERMILAPHFANGWMSNARADLIGEILNRCWKVRLP